MQCRPLPRVHVLLAAFTGLLLALPSPGAPSLPWTLGALGAALTLAGLALAQRRPRAPAHLLGFTCLAALVALSIAQRPREPLVGMALLIGAVLVMLPPLAPVEAARRGRLRHHLPAFALGACVVALPAELAVDRAPVLFLLAALALLELLGAVARLRASDPDPFGVLLASPAHMLVSSFAALALVGTGLLLMPLSHTLPKPIAPVDALFTAVSAACVTGLAVLDTSKDFSFLGQLIILGLIQVGGLGIMTFATAATVLLGRRLGLREEAVAMNLLGGTGGRIDLERALGDVLRVTFIAELGGAALLFPAFLAHGDSWSAALWRAVFTSISAFCNAGFALQSDSLVPYQQDPFVLLVVSALIVVGGLGPAVVLASLRRRREPLPLQARIVLASSAILLLLPLAAVLALEWSHLLAGLPVGDRLVNAWFQSVTLRTAGFNAIDMGALGPATWTLCVAWMFIGGSPGSTAGGVKTTTIAVLLLAALAAIRGRRDAEVFGRSIPHRTVYEAGAVLSLFILSAGLALFALQLTQSLPLDQVLFEVVSALATVGLSMGATAQLDGVGKLVIIACMFAGRVGPLSLSILLVGRDRPLRRLPLEAIQVG